MYVETDALLNVRADIQSRGCGEEKKKKKTCSVCVEFCKYLAREMLVHDEKITAHHQPQQVTQQRREKKVRGRHSLNLSV